MELDEIYLRRKVISATASEESEPNRYRVDNLLLVPMELRPSGSEEVGTIMYIERRDFALASYSLGGEATSREVVIILVDVDRNRAIGAMQFCSEEPPPTAKSTESKWSTEPDSDKLRDFIASLRRVND
jgi:hypothetical protein